MFFTYRKRHCHLNVLSILIFINIFLLSLITSQQSNDWFNLTLKNDNLNVKIKYRWNNMQIFMILVQPDMLQNHFALNCLFVVFDLLCIMKISLKYRYFSYLIKNILYKNFHMTLANCELTPFHELA